VRLSVRVDLDDTALEVARAFDYDFDGQTFFDIPEMPKLPESWGVGLIVGSSGSGKSTLLSTLGKYRQPEWDDNLSVASHFEGAEIAKKRLSAVGLNSIPSIMRPYRVLSTGEKHRADLARSLGDGALVDEFTSVVDRIVARSICVSIRRFVRNEGVSRVVFASPHRDIVEWLEPDWVFDTDTGEFSRGYKRRPKLEFELYGSTRDAWKIFRNHHYLSAEHHGAKCYVLMYNGMPVGFASSIAMPSGTLKDAWRGHRTVILPDWQGMGLGNRLSDVVAWLHTQEGKRYYSKTAHYRMGGYRENSPDWKPTSKNRMKRGEWAHGKKGGGDTKRICYSHEYVGSKPEYFTETSP
jgi:ABC-type ATPase involved in cell division